VLLYAPRGRVLPDSARAFAHRPAIARAELMHGGVHKVCANGEPKRPNTNTLAKLPGET